MSHRFAASGAEDSFHPAAVMMARAICFCRRKPPAVLKGIAEGGNTYPLLIASWFGSKAMVQQMERSLIPKM